MNRTQIERKVNLVLDDCLGISFSLIDPNAMLNADYGVDSIDAVDLTLALEHKFEIHIEDEDIGWKDWTIDEVYNYVEQKLKK